MRRRCVMGGSSKILRRLLVAVVAAVVPASASMMLTAPSALAQSGEDIDLEVFYRELQPYGEWFRHARWGEVWRPNVDESWRPYTRGHWARTEDHGWMWVAEEEWGWAVFHYGRWVFDDEEESWIWIPGSQWAPAWVQWRESEDQVGWAPLPPDSYLDDGVMRFNASAYDNSRYSRYWVFVSPRYMFEPGLYRHVSSVSRQASFFRSTRPVTVHHHMYRGNIYHPGPDWRRVERWAGRSVPLVTLRSVTNTRDQGWRRSGSSPSVLPIYRPRVSVLPDRPRQPLPNVGPRPERPDRDGRRGDPRPDGRPDRPDFRLGPGGWQPVGRPQPTPPGEQPRPGRPNIQSDPPINPGGRTGRPNVQTDPPSNPGGRTGRPNVQTDPPSNPGGRGSPPDTRTSGPGPSPWFPPSRPQQPPPGAQPPSPVSRPGPQPGQPARRPDFEVERPSNDK